jgi:hypothetical protein
VGEEFCDIVRPSRVCPDVERFETFGNDVDGTLRPIVGKLFFKDTSG